jgi:hypothetical protein
MTLAFDNRALLPLAVLVALPLLLHLFARSRPPKLLFGSTELLRRAVRSTIRLRRPKDWLLLALRTLLVAAAVGLFLRPVLFSGRQAPAAGAGRHVVVIVDATASMAYAEGGQTRFGAACAEAEEVLRGLGNRDTANVVWLRAEPEAVFPEMAVNLAGLRDALRRAGARPEAGSPAAALALAIDLLRPQTGRREVVVISDFQRTTWSQPPAAPPDITLSYVRVGNGDTPNAAVAAVAVQPPAPLAGEPLTVTVDVRNFASAPANRTVFLAAGETRQSRQVVIAPWGAANATFALPSAAAHSLAIEAGLDEDAFPGDDRRWLVVEVQPHLRVGMIGGDPAYAPAWTRALRSLDWARVLPATLAELGADAASFDALLLAGWDGSGSDALVAAARRGCTLVVAPAAGVAPAALASLLDIPPSGATPLLRERHPDGLTLVCRRPDDPLLRVFENGGRGDPARSRVRSRLQLAPDALPADDVILAYADGVPALARHTPATGGARWFWNVPLDAASGAFATQPEFVCLLGELLLTSRATPSRADTETASGGRVRRPLAAAGAATLVNDAGATLPVTMENGRLVSATPPLPGLYRWLRGDECETHAVVNFPAEESDLRATPPGAVRTAGAAVAGSGVDVRRLRDGLPLWPWLLGAVAACALIEGLVAWSAGGAAGGR